MTLLLSLTFATDFRKYLQLFFTLFLVMIGPCGLFHQIKKNTLFHKIFIRLIKDERRLLERRHRNELDNN